MMLMISLYLQIEKIKSKHNLPIQEVKLKIGLKMNKATSIYLYKYYKTYLD